MSQQYFLNCVTGDPMVGCEGANIIGLEEGECINGVKTNYLSSGYCWM